MNIQSLNLKHHFTNNTQKTIHTIIYEYLKEHQGEYHAGYEFVNKSIGVGGQSYFLGSSSDRKCRLMAEEGKIERKHEKGYAWFRVKPTPKPIPLVAQKNLELVENIS